MTTFENFQPRSNKHIHSRSEKQKNSGQDGAVGRYTLPPRTTKRRTTTNLKTKNNQNCQKIELYVCPTTNKLKKKHSSRLVGRAETGSWDGEDLEQGSGGQPHICVQISQKEQLRNETYRSTQGSSTGKESLKPLAVKSSGGCGNGRNSQAHRIVR